MKHLCLWQVSYKGMRKYNILDQNKVESKMAPANSLKL